MRSDSGERKHAVAVRGQHRMAAAELCDAGVARRRVQLLEPGALGDLPRERVLPAARADDEHSHDYDPAMPGDEPAVPPYSATQVDIERVPGGPERDVVAVEEPLEIRINGAPVAVTMRTPGHDEELALGFCLSEGLQPAGAAVPDDLAANTVDVDAPGFDPERLRRSFYVSSSCGVCGKGAIEAVAVEARKVEADVRVPAPLLLSLPDRLREAQGAFAATGGLHAAGLFDRNGTLLCAREDVGRHNAVDKVLGWAFLEERLPLAGRRALPERPHRLRARAEGGGRRLPDHRRGRGAVEPRRRAGGRPRHHPLRLHARGADERLLRGLARRQLTGVLLVGGASTRFGSPKALAELDGETLAERGWRVLGELCEERLAVGKQSDGLELPFPVLDDGSEVRASIAGPRRRASGGVVRAVRRPAGRLPARHGRAARLARGRVPEIDAAIPQTGPLPGAYRTTRCGRSTPALDAGRLAMRNASPRWTSPTSSAIPDCSRTSTRRRSCRSFASAAHACARRARRATLRQPGRSPTPAR